MRQLDRDVGQCDGYGVGGDRYAVPGECGNIFCPLSESDHQYRGEAVAGMKRLLVRDLFDDGVLLCDRHRIGVMMDTLTRARSAKREEGMTAGAAGIHRCFTGNPPYSIRTYSSGRLWVS
jgi:hypothetical protein